MGTGRLKDKSVYEFIREHSEDVVVFGYGGTDLSTGKVYYKFALVYKMHLKMVEGEAVGSSNRCILQGIFAAVKKINKPSNVYVITSTALGFKKAIQKKKTKDLMKIYALILLSVLKMNRVETLRHIILNIQVWKLET